MGGGFGGQIGTENLFQPSKQTGSFNVISRKAVCVKVLEEYYEPTISQNRVCSRVCSSCGRKIRTLHHL